MGIYVNPGNISFQSAVRSEIYVDKTGLLNILNKRLGSERRWFAVSRARRFGKSMAAGMIDAYYSLGSDSRELFAPFEIAKSADFEEHLNRYNVLHFDASTYFYMAESPEEMLDELNAALIKDFKEEFPEVIDENIKTAPQAVQAVFRATGRQFVIIIDEWECVIRDAKDEEKWSSQWLKYLRGFFKTEESKQFLALGYITGILPIKTFQGESAMNNFMEYTMIAPRELAPFFGFTESEVEPLCEEYDMDIIDVRDWYDGYHMQYIERGEGKKLLHIYNPNSLSNALMMQELDYYWKNTGSFAGLNKYIARNEAGLKDMVLRMLTGESISVNVSGFQNDLVSYRNADDVLTALIHMGYLGYDADTKEAFIPNEEVREVFRSAIVAGDWDEVRDAIEKSDNLLKATIAGDTVTVAKTLDESQQDYASILEYNDENSLACAVMMSYYAARQHYIIVREFPAGRGFADIAFIPKRNSDKPAMIVELKYNKDAETAIDQIHEKNYSGRLADYAGDLLLVGVNYTKGKKSCSCVIERVRSEGHHQS